MILSTTETVPNKEITKIVGIAKGSAVRARNIGRGLFAGLKSIVGGEIEEYTTLLSQSRDQAIERMTLDAEKMGADAVVNVRLTTSIVMQTTSEVLAYGAAVTLA